MGFSIQMITAENRAEVLSLKVKESQAGYIETVAACLAEAKQCLYFCPAALYDGDALVGFAMYGFFPSEGIDGRVWLDRFFIDAAHQGNGLGRRFMKYLLAYLMEKYRYREIYLSLYEENKAALALYQSLGFMLNGEIDVNGEKVMVVSEDNLQQQILSNPNKVTQKQAGS